MITIKENPISRSLTFSCLRPGDIYQFVNYDYYNGHCFFLVKDGLSFDLTSNASFSYSTTCGNWIMNEKVKVFDGDLYIHEKE